MMLPRFTFTDRATPFLQIGTGDTRIPTGTAQWDTATWDGAGSQWASNEPYWRDVTCDAFSLRCEYGRRRSNERFVPGVATIEVDNTSGWADPLATGDPAALSMRPGRQIRFGVNHVTYGQVVLWRGYIDEMEPVYEAGAFDRLTFQCIDALGEVNRARLAGRTADGAGETADTRIDRLLTLAGWPADKRVLETTSITLVAAELNGQVADLLGRAADSSGGSVFGDRDGNIVYRNRDWQAWDLDTEVDAYIGNGVWFGDVPLLTEGWEPILDENDNPILVEGWNDDVCPVMWERPFSRADMATRAIMGRDAETAAVADDVTGQTLYGIEPFERVDLWTELDAQLETLADRALAVRSYTSVPVIRSVSLDAATSYAAMDVMTTADPYAEPPTHYMARLIKDRGVVFLDRVFATGIIHEITPDRWTAQINLDLAGPYGTTAGFWDTDLWDQATWAA